MTSSSAHSQQISCSDGNLLYVFLKANECLKQGGSSEGGITICANFVRLLAVTQHKGFAKQSSIHCRPEQARSVNAVTVIALPMCIVQHGH